MQRIKSMIVFCDMRHAAFTGMDDKASLQFCSDLADYACNMAHERGVQALSVFSMLPDGSMTPLSVHTKKFSDDLMSVISDELEFTEAVGVLEFLGAASIIPEDLKTVCGEKFRPVKPFSQFFGPKAGDDFRQEYLRQRRRNKNAKMRQQIMMRGGRQK